MHPLAHRLHRRPRFSATEQIASARPLKPLIIKNHPHHPPTKLSWISSVVCHNSILSRKRVSTKPGVIQVEVCEVGVECLDGGSFVGGARVCSAPASVTAGNLDLVAYSAASCSGRAHSHGGSICHTHSGPGCGAVNKTSYWDWGGGTNTGWHRVIPNDPRCAPTTTTTTTTTDDYNHNHHYYNHGGSSTPTASA